MQHKAKHVVRVVVVAKNNIVISSLMPAHWPAVAKIYQSGMDTGIATFETQLPEFEAWDKKYLTHSRLIALENDRVLGWATLAPTSAREVYKGVAEVSIYIDEAARGQGIGSFLMQDLIKSSEQHGIWTLYAAVFPQNKPSIALHEKNGFRLIGKRERIAQRDGEWHDNLLFERRSSTIGIEIKI